MKSNLLPNVQNAFGILQRNPNQANLAELISQMHKAGASHIHIDGMSKEFASEFIHNNSKAIKRKDFEKRLKASLPKPVDSVNGGAPQSTIPTNTASPNTLAQPNSGLVQIHA